MGHGNQVSDSYIDEHEAIEILSKLIGEEITVNEMRECASKGIVPGYMRFMPMDRYLYNGGSFNLVYDPDIELGNIEYSNHTNLTTFHALSGEEWVVLPYPLPKDGLVKDSNGVAYRVFVARNDGRLEIVTDQHFVRVYAAQEVRRAAKSVKRYLKKGDEQPMPHSFFPTWEDPGDYGMAPKAVWIISPIVECESLKSKKPARPLDAKLDPRERTSLYLMITALAQKAGYPLDDPNGAETMLQKDLADIGICEDLSGKGTISGHFAAALLAAQKAEKESRERASSK